MALSPPGVELFTLPLSLGFPTGRLSLAAPATEVPVEFDEAAGEVQLVIDDRHAAKTKRQIVFMVLEVLANYRSGGWQI